MNEVSSSCLLMLCNQQYDMSGSWNCDLDK